MNHYNVNNKIKATNILLIDENGKNIGSISTKEALNKAKSLGLDLVEVNSNINNPVCKIMDFGKWKYSQSKKNKNNKISQKQYIKELKFRPNTGDNDLVYRAKQVDKFLRKGDKVKLIVRFKGREQEHMLETGKNLLERFLSLISVQYVVDSVPSIDSGLITMVLSKRPSIMTKTMGPHL